jgi:orotidine-5'-phosphate decarboxylase
VTNPLIVALDTRDHDRLRALATALGPEVGGLKVGLEAFAAIGPAAVATARAAAPVFLDLKLHDIPNTVAGAAAAAARLGVAQLTVHATGGPKMIAAAAGAAPEVTVLAVTILTSLDEATLAAVGLPPSAEAVPRLAAMAVEAGAGGLVCAAPEIAAVRAAVGPGPLLVVPGIRPPGADPADQSRIATPAAALTAGADRLVIGRPITATTDPAHAARTLLREART